MSISHELDDLCELIKNADTQPNLDFDEAKEFLASILRTTPLIYAEICDRAEDDYESISPKYITATLLFPHSNDTNIVSEFKFSIAKAVNEQIADCINLNEINEPEDPLDRQERRIGMAG